MITVSITRAEKPIPYLPIIQYDLGIVTQLWESSEWDNRVQVVQACPLMDYPSGRLKGHTYVVSDAWVLYMKRVLTPRAWSWWIQTDGVNFLMINRDSKWNETPPNWEEPAFEDICLPNNFVAMDKHTTTHSRIVNKHSLNFPASTLDPKKDNWFYKPTEYHMATVQKTKPPHEVGRVGDGTYFVYTPMMGQREQWIQKSRVEPFPKLPTDVTYEGKIYTITGYSLLGASVYGYADGVYIPLRLVQFIGDLRHPCPEWKLNTRPVPPEVKPEWKMLS